MTTVHIDLIVWQPITDYGCSVYARSLYSSDDDTPSLAVSCVYTGHMRSPGHSLWGTAAGLGKVRVLVQDSVATAGSCCCCWGVLVVAALSHSSATTELRCTHTLQQGETSTSTATASLHIGSYVAKYFKQILQPVSQQNEILTLPLIMTAF